MNAEREKLRKKPIDDEDDDENPKGGRDKEITASSADPDSGMFVKAAMPVADERSKPPLIICLSAVALLCLTQLY